MSNTNLNYSPKEEFRVVDNEYIQLTHMLFDSKILEILSLDELAARYNDIDQQSQLFKGQILLEARNRFPSNVEFGNWLSVNFTELNTSNTGKLINLARFFQNGRTLDGIPISAGYLLAAPCNQEIADKVYTQIKDKNLKFNEIKKIINEKKCSLPSKEVTADVNVDAVNDADENAVILYMEETELEAIQIDYEISIPIEEEILSHFNVDEYIEDNRETTISEDQSIQNSISYFSFEEKIILLSLLDKYEQLVVTTDYIEFTINIPKVQDLLLTSGRVYQIEEIKEATNKLYLRSVQFTNNFTETRWVSEKSFSSLKGDVMIKLKLHPMIIQSASKVVNYCKLFRYSWVSKLQMKSSIRLYEYFYPYIDHGLLQVDICTLKKIYQLSDTYNSMADLIEYVVTPCVDEINSISNLTVEFETEKQGMEIIGVTFIFEYKLLETPQLSNDEIIEKLRGWEDIYVSRDKHRVKKTAEVFTSTPLVQEVLDTLDPELFNDPSKNFIDNSCGNGQFLSEVLIRKLANGIDYKAAISGIYGVDLMPDNVQTCRNRLLCGMEQFRYIVEENIVCADALKYDYKFNTWK